MAALLAQVSAGSLQNDFSGIRDQWGQLRNQIAWQREMEKEMATIEKREYLDKISGKTIRRFKAKIRLKGFPYEEATFDRKSDAEGWAAKREYEIKNRQLFGVQAHRTKTVKDLLGRYEENLKATNPKRHKTSLPIIKVWEASLGSLKIGDLTKDIIIEERDKLKKRHVKDDPDRPVVTNASVNRMIAVLRRALNLSVNEWGWLSFNPLSGIKNLPEPKGRTRFLQGEELERLLQACRESGNPDLLAIVILAITTGARRGEIAKIRLKDVSFEMKKILIPTSKNGKPRMLHLADNALALVSAVHSRAKQKQVYLFISPHDITRPNDFRTAWRTAIRTAQIEDFKFHDLRHSAASFFAGNGAGLHQIAEILGHGSLNVTRRYTHLLESQTAKVVETTAAKVFGHDKAGLA
jgi:integrase